MKKAFTLVEVLIVVSILGLIAAIGIPAYLSSHASANNNMKEINIAAVNAAKDQWAIMNNKAAGTTCSWNNISAYVGGSVTNQAGLSVGGCAINLNPIGTSASY
ncbi:MAG: prepilin-type N-terminal cleavage/methylation domain-containing protein [Pontiellaceae bacterium]|jgi:prepilin-type N-terminal cleavage/methylation domain-containing protein|nr:prepilin-type N-terminal cleavage/methylation domain-containing protein [Pontiellaceae bacterium]